MRLSAQIQRGGRLAAKILWGLLDTRHPVLAQVVIVRKCNLACGYCFEYDKVSTPVPFGEMVRRIDALADLGTTMITLTGGEPMLHPDLERIVAHARGRGMYVSTITNGYLLTRDRILRLNEAGLDHLQMSIDNVEPDEVSQKSLRLLEPKLKWLSELADFTVAINSVVGSGVKNPEDALEVARRTHELGFMASLAVVHDSEGQIKPMGPREEAVYVHLKKQGGREFTGLNASFQDNLAKGLPNAWRCRAGARYLYVDEFGLVHYCAQQRGYPAIPVVEYTKEHVRRAFNAEKPCAPYCGLNCVHQVALLDNWRSPQQPDGWIPLQTTEPARSAQPVPESG
jgi:MoaA/NifB/PqqE/SkfB family radical SAM enzyme